MATRALHFWYLPVALIALGLFIAGCSAPGTTNYGSGYGADAGQWPQSPNRTAANSSSRPATDEPPTASLTVVLYGKAAEHDALSLGVTQIELEADGKWATAATAEEITKLQLQPMGFGEKGAAYLLARKEFPRRKYTRVRLQYANTKSQLVRGDAQPATLTVPTTFTLGDWTPEAGKPNLLSLSIDGAKATVDGATATVPAEAITVKTALPTGEIAGKVDPIMPTARINIYWGTTNTLFGSATPDAQTGAFTFPNLPAGSYRVELSAPGYRLAEPLTKLIAVESKSVALGKLDLVAATVSGQ